MGYFTEIRVGELFRGGGVGYFTVLGWVISRGVGWVILQG